MKAVLYDCSDHPNPRHRGCTFRILDEVGGILLQAQVFLSARSVCESIATGLGLELQYVGPKLLEPPQPAAGDGVGERPQAVVSGHTNGGWMNEDQRDSFCDKSVKQDGERFQGLLF